MPKPVRAQDVAAYILRKCGRMTTWKLQKLCYYAQAWSLVWDEEPLFRERIEAWAGGPVIPKLYEWHRGRFQVQTAPPGSDPKRLNLDQQETVDAVLRDYGDMPSAKLSELTHQETPWRDARLRAGLQIGQRGNVQIRLDSMVEYYNGLYSADQEEE